MDKIKVGIPRALFYYHYGKLWQHFFYKLNIDMVISPLTNKEIIDNGLKYSNDEMCLSLKTYIGHINYLKDKCDYILVPRIDNYGRNDQTCTNFLGAYDVINNIFNLKILNYNIELTNRETELKGFIKIGKILNKSKKEIIKAYKYANIKTKKQQKLEIIENMNKLKSDKIRILLIGHPYNMYDNYMGRPILKLLKKLNCEIIYCDKLDINKTNILSKKLSSNLYWKYSKENIGAIELLKNKIDGIIFISSFPCGLDSIVNELVIRRITIPYLNLIIDDINAEAGIETRLESFIDILERQTI